MFTHQKVCLVGYLVCTRRDEIQPSFGSWRSCICSVLTKLPCELVMILLVVFLFFFFPLLGAWPDILFLEPGIPSLS